MAGTGPNRSRFRLSVKTAPRSEADHDENWREALRAYPESLINLDVGAKVGYVGVDYVAATGVLSDHTFNTVFEDDYDFFTSPSSRLVVPRGMDGRYLCRANLQIANNSVTGLLLGIKYFPANGANFIMKSRWFFGAGTVIGAFGNVEISVPIPVVAGDAVGSCVLHQSGANRSFAGLNEVLNGVDPPAPVLEMWRISRKG